MFHTPIMFIEVIILSRYNNKIRFNTTLSKDLIIQLKIVGAKKDKKLNEMIEEGVKYVLDKYEGRN